MENNEFKDEEQNQNALTAIVNIAFNKQNLETTKHVYNFYKQLLSTFIYACVALLVLTLALNSRFCQCEADITVAEKVLECVSTAISCFYILLMLLLINFGREPIEKNGAELRMLFEDVRSVSNYFRELDQQYSESIIKLRIKAKVGVCGLIIVILLSLVSIII